MTVTTWDEVIRNRDPHDARRLAVIDRLGILQTGAERGFDDVALVAHQLFGDRNVALTFVTREQVVIKALRGVGVQRSPREGSFSDMVVQLDDTLLVPDARQDPRFAAAPVVLGEPFVRSFAGVPIHSGGEALGAMTISSPDPDTFTAHEVGLLWTLARQVDRLLELRWYRALSTEPSQHHVDALAARVRSLDDFERTVQSEVHPSWLYDAATFRFLAVNDRAVEAYGWTRDEFLTMTIEDIRPTADRVALRAVLASRTYDAAAHRHWRHRRANGTNFTVHVNSADVAIPGMDARLVVTTDLSTRLYGRSALVHAATHDALTGLPNRAAFLELLAQEVAHRHADLAVLFIDIDGFKHVNSTIGHGAADHLLVTTSARLLADVRECDTVARIGGDEFVVLCRDTSEVEALEVAHRLATRLREPAVVDGREYHMTSSIGVAAVHRCSDVERLLGDAELAMREARKGGLGQVAAFDAVLRETAMSRAQLVQELNLALHRQEFVVHYQPIVDLCGPDVHLEALVRWQHPTRGLLAPGAFLDIANDAGLLPEIGSLVLRELAAMAVRTREAGVAARVAFNLPAAQLNESFVVELQRVCAETGMAPTQLIVEVTESAFAQNATAVSAASRLRSLGVGMSIDDFGTGYSSIDRLRTLDVDALKLDRSFVAQVHTVQGRNLARAVVSLADAIGVPVVAEGVETTEQLEAVRLLGCRYVQGYLLARPVPEREALALLRGGFSVCVD